jgi:hypothetical protein
MKQFKYATQEITPVTKCLVPIFTNIYSPYFGRNKIALIMVISMSRASLF